MRVVNMSVFLRKSDIKKKGPACPKFSVFLENRLYSGQEKDYQKSTIGPTLKFKKL